MKKLLLTGILLGASSLFVGCVDSNETTNITQTDSSLIEADGAVINTYTIVSDAIITTKRITKYDDIAFLSCVAYIGANNTDMTDVLGVLLVKDEMFSYTQTRIGDTQSTLTWEFEITEVMNSALACGLIYSKDGTEVKQRSRNSYPENTDASSNDENVTEN